VVIITTPAKILWFLAALVALPAVGGPVSSTTFYSGMCDASAAVALDSELFAVANDEDNAIRIYRADQGGPPVQSIELSRFLRVDRKKPETDLEAAAWLGNRIFWITSHGRNHEGKFRPNRHFFFATVWEKLSGNFQLVTSGKPYQNLLADLVRDPRLRPFKLDAASRRAPKLPDALNIEGLCATPDHHLLIGFRNPIPQGRALLVPLLNPNDLISGKAAKLGDPILLDLGGLGVRDLGYWHDRYIIVAGSYDAGDHTRLFQWHGGKTKPEPMPDIDLHHFNAEAVIAYPDGRWPFQLLSDDGMLEVNGIVCKKLPDPAQRAFRSVWVNPPRDQ